MITCLIYRERGGERGLEFVAKVTVADTATDPETIAWTTWSRSNKADRGNYAVVRAGKRFSVQDATTRTSSALGAMV